MTCLRRGLSETRLTTRGESTASDHHRAERAADLELLGEAAAERPPGPRPLRVEYGQESGVGGERVPERPPRLRSSGRPPARVSLVGAGPGDPGLLTLRAAHRLEQADVVFHDALVPRCFLSLCRPEARFVAVGRRRGEPAMSLDRVCDAMADAARKGLRVVRLKGGDPFVFGRGAEEALALSARGVPVEIVPGVSAGTGVPAIAGIPLTHRGIARSAAFVTAHDLGAGPDGLDLRSRLRRLAEGADTLVVFMGGAERARVRAALLDAGLAPATPVAVLEAIGTPEAIIQLTSLGGRDRLPREPGGGPVLIVVGETVTLAASLDLGETRSTAGRERASSHP